MYSNIIYIFIYFKRVRHLTDLENIVYVCVCARARTRVCSRVYLYACVYAYVSLICFYPLLFDLFFFIPRESFSTK